MEIGVTLWKASWLLTLVTMVQPLGITETLKITRHNNGDIFASTQDNVKRCSEDTCVGLSSGTATAISRRDMCTCRCHMHLPAFREDLKICVDDIHECALAPFVGGSTSQQIPFVFLPLKGQIIHPSKEISFSGIHKPVCGVSGAKFLTEGGWADLRNPLDTDVPFRLFRDEGRTFLQWLGEPELRTKMSGRMVMVQLMCRELDEAPLLGPVPDVFSPCVAFRIVGTPSRLQANVTEVAFSLESSPDLEHSDGDSLSVSEYVAIGICSVLLGLIYVASIFLYLHLKKRNLSKNSNKVNDTESMAAAEEGIVKSNPLLNLPHHFVAAENAYSDTNSSDNEMAPDLIQHHDSQVTSAIIHSQHRNRYRSSSPNSPSSSESYQDSSSFEKLPEENVSIVETLDDRPDNLKALTGTLRKKLYFNPAYFEPHLLAAPPPAALEFLAKIREVITIAKQKMASKKYSPTLLNIPEEDTNYSVEPSFDFSRPSSRRGSVISLKRENSRRKSCTGCPGCEPQDFKAICEKLPEFPVLGACQNCSSTNDSKQRSIRKWLEDIPVLRVDEHCGPVSTPTIGNPKRIRSPTRSLPPEGISSERTLSPRPASERAAFSPNKSNHVFKHPKDKIHKPRSPPPPVPTQTSDNQEGYYDTVPKEGRMNLPPPDMIQEAMEMENQAEETRIPTLTKKQMNAVINELTIHKTMLEAANRELAKMASAGYETDSLERNGKEKGYSTPSDYAEAPSSQASPSLSTALPVDEEITMQNAIFNKRTGNMTISKLTKEALVEEEHDYELVVLKGGSLVNSETYNFPELLKAKTGGGYSLVSEVYVNNGYNYGSNPSSPSESNCSTLEKRTLKVRYDGGADKPGKLLIEVEDCLDHYIPVHDSDEFEPDTLDRPNKYEKLSIPQNNNSNNNNTPEQCSQILLRSSGTFKNQTLDINANDTEVSNFNRIFGSLRELYEEKRKLSREKEQFSLESFETDEEGKLLTLEDRHSKRQRVKTTSSGPVVPPDLIPPPPHDGSPIYEHPKPPRKVLNSELLKSVPDPKNEPNRGVGGEKTNSCSAGTPEDDTEYKLCLLQKSKANGLVTDLIQTEDLILKKNVDDQFIFHCAVNEMPFPVPIKTNQSLKGGRKNSPKVYFRDKTGRKKRSWQNSLKPEDSGYLSTDSNESRIKNFLEKKLYAEANGSESDESLGDGHSESGAESVETHSVFFGRFHRKQHPNYTTSMDSGVINYDDGNSSSDSETVSYTTVVPVSSNNSSLAMR